MSDPMTPADQATQEILRTLALVALGFWAVATAAYGFEDLANGIRNVHEFRASMRSTESSVTFNNPMLGLSLLTGLGMMLGTLAGGVGALLGAIQIALSGRGALWCVGFSILSVSGVVAAVVLGQARNNSDSFAMDYVNWTVLGALALPVIAVVVFVGSWVSVRLPVETPRLVTA